MEGYVLQTLLILGMVVLSALFSATETALLSLGPAGVHRILEEERQHSGLLEVWREHPNRLLASLLVLNNGVNILASAMATSLAADVMENRFGIVGVGGWAVAVAVGVMTFLIVVFGEVVPKTFAKHNARRLVAIFPITYLFCWLVRPFSKLLQRATGWMIESAGGSVGTPDVTEEEIETMIRLGTAQGSLTEDKQELLASVIEFSETMAKEIMVPRTDVVGFEIGAALPEVVRIVTDRHYSRYPVYDEDLDTVVGIVTVKDLFAAIATPQQPFSLAQLAARRPPLIVPESKKIGDLLKEFQHEHIQMAVAVDEFGGTAGIVTMEDVIEEIVGEIYDEHDRAESGIRQVDPGKYLVPARTPIEDLAETFGIELPEQDIYESVGGLVMNQAGKVPLAGESVEFAGLRLEVRERTRTRILALLVTRVEERAPEGGHE